MQASIGGCFWPSSSPVAEVSRGEHLQQLVYIELGLVHLLFSFLRGITGSHTIGVPTPYC